MEILIKNIYKYKRIIKFGIVGFVTVLIDLGIYNIGMHFSLNQYLSRLISLVIAITIGFFFHKYWTFRNNNPAVYKQYFSFIIISSAGIGLNLIIMYILNLILQDKFSEIIRANLVAIIAIILVFFFNYFMQSKFTFSKYDKK